MKKTIYGEQARKKILSGISKLAKAVRVTLGGEGRNVIFRSHIMEQTGRILPGPPESTRDGVTVAREFDLEDEFEKMGSDLLRLIALKINYEAGDGTSTGIILAEEIIKAGFREVERGASPIELSNQILKKTKDIVEQLKKQSKKITAKDMAHVGKIASRSQEIGEMVAGVIKKIGTDGAVDIQDSNDTNTSVEVVDGFKINNGYMSKYFATEPRKLLAEHPDANILVTDLKITTIDDLLPLLKQMEQPIKDKTMEKELVILTDQIGYGVMKILVHNHTSGQFKFLVVRLPEIGVGARTDEFGDIAIATGAQFISDDTGLGLADIKLEHLGTADRVVSSPEETLIMGGGGDKKKIEEKIMALKVEHTAEKDQDKKKRIERRIGLLQEGIAVIRVGGGSVFEQAEKKYRVEDAVAAIKAAVKEGVIDGGGLPLARIASKLTTKTPIDRIFRIALMVPFKQIVKNGGQDPQKININKGYDISNKKYGDMFQLGIIDPVKVTITALENASSVASNVLITETVITDIYGNKPTKSQ